MILRENVVSIIKSRTNIDSISFEHDMDDVLYKQIKESEDLLPVDENIIHISIPYEWEDFSSLDDESEEYKLIKYQNLLTRIWNYINRLRDKGFDYRNSYTEDGFVLFDLVVDNIYTEQEKQLFKEVTGTLDSKLKKELDDKYKTMY